MGKHATICVEKVKCMGPVFVCSFSIIGFV